MQRNIYTYILIKTISNTSEHKIKKPEFIVYKVTISNTSKHKIKKAEFIIYKVKQFLTHLNTR